MGIFNLVNPCVSVAMGTIYSMEAVCLKLSVPQSATTDSWETGPTGHLVLSLVESESNQKPEFASDPEAVDKINQPTKLKNVTWEHALLLVKPALSCTRTTLHTKTVVLRWLLDQEKFRTFKASDLLMIPGRMLFLMLKF